MKSKNQNIKKKSIKNITLSMTNIIMELDLQR